MSEEWRDIPGYEGRYQASTEGRIRSVERVVKGKSKTGRWFEAPRRSVVLRPGLSRGYLIVNLHPTGTVAVHLLVARTWLPPQPSPNHEVNHCDGVKANCRLSNLEWLTSGENNIHAVYLGLNRQALPVTDGTSVWPSQAQAAFEVVGDRRRGSEISRVLRGERTSAFGRRWSLM